MRGGRGGDLLMVGLLNYAPPHSENITTGIKMPYTNKTLRPRGDAVLLIGGKKKDASIDDFHLLDSGRRPIERRLSSSGFHG